MSKYTRYRCRECRTYLHDNATRRFRNGQSGMAFCSNCRAIELPTRESGRWTKRKLLGLIPFGWQWEPEIPQ